MLMVLPKLEVEYKLINRFFIDTSITFHSE